MNKQPYYHDIQGQLLFTATEEIPQHRIDAAITQALRSLPGVISDTVEIFVTTQVDPGDPADLM